MINSAKQCSVDGCPNPVKARLLCSKHHAYWLRNGVVSKPPEPPHVSENPMIKYLKNKKCSVDGCDGVHTAKGYCRKHYRISVKEENKLTKS